MTVFDTCPKGRKFPRRFHVVPGKKNLAFISSRDGKHNRPPLLLTLGHMLQELASISPVVNEFSN